MSFCISDRIRDLSKSVEERGGAVMRELSVGEIIRRRRIETGLTQEELCEGICDPVTVSRIENMKQPPSRFTVDALLQRLGVSGSRYFFSFQGSICDGSGEDIEKEGQIEVLQESITRFCETDGEVTESGRYAAFKMLEELEALADSGNHIERQRVLLTKARVMEKSGGLAAERIRLLEEAILLTVPKFHEQNLCGGVYGYDEIDMIRRLGLAYSEDGQTGRAVGLLSQLYDYISVHVGSIPHPARIIAPIARSYGTVLMRDGKVQQAFEMAEYGMRNSVPYGGGGELLNLLDLEAECLELLGKTDLGSEKALEAFALRKTAEIISVQFENENAANSKKMLPPERSCNEYQNVHLGKVIKSERERRGFSQRMLCQGLCTTATLSRFENGEQSPSWRCVCAMLERLDMAWDDYTAILTADEIRIDRMRWDILKLSFAFGKEKEENRRDIQNAVLNMLDNMEAEVKKTDVVNRQFIMRQRAIIAYQTQACDLNEKLDQLIAALHMTLPALSFEDMNQALYTDEELSLLVNIADTYHSLRQVRQAFYMYEQLYRILKKKYHNHYLMALLTHSYALDLANEKMYEDAIRVADDGIAVTIAKKTYMELPILLHTQAECFYLMGQTEKCKEYYAYAAPLYRLFGDYRNLKILSVDAEERFHMKF